MEWHLQGIPGALSFLSSLLIIPGVFYFLGCVPVVTVQLVPLQRDGTRGVLCSSPLFPFSFSYKFHVALDLHLSLFFVPWPWVDRRLE